MHSLVVAVVLNSWISVGPSGVAVNTVAADAVNSQVVYAGTDSGLFKSDDRGAAWRLSGSRPPCTNVTTIATDSIDSKVVYAATETVTPDCIQNRTDGLFRSENSAQDWTILETGFPAVSIKPAPGVSGRIYFLALDCFLRNNLFLDCGSQLARSDDFGTTSVPIFPSEAPADLQVSAFDVDGKDPDRLWAVASGVEQSGLFRSDDGGASWALIPSAPAAESVAVDPRHGEVLLLANGQGSVRSSDAGASWSAITPSSTAFTQFRFDRRRAGIVYGIDDTGAVFRSIDAGVSWAPFGTGTGGVAVSALDESSDGRALYAATGAGVFRLDLGTPSPYVPVASPPPAIVVRGRP